jgi:flagellar hook protein FlgE
VVNALGQRLTGYPGGGVGQDPVPLQLALGDVAPTATTTAQLTANLRAGATPIPATPAFDITNADTYTNRATMTVYDSLGNGHTMDQYFIKREGAGGNSVYEVRYVLDGTEQGTPQQLTFNENGTIVSPLTPVSITFPNPGGTTSPADDLTIAFNYGKVTQFAGDFSNTPLPDGNASGTFTGLAVGSDGSIVASYSSGAKTVIGTVALARFNNEMGLTPIGGNAWSESPESGQPVLGQPGTNSLSTITGGKLEASNVNTSDELVNMIIAQRTYQANAQTIKTQDQVLQTLLQIR